MSFTGTIMLVQTRLAIVLLLLSVLSGTVPLAEHPTVHNVGSAMAADRHSAEFQRAGTAEASGESADVLKVPLDLVPNLAKPYTAINVKSGDWTDPATWRGGRVPGNDDVVRIAPDTKVTYGANSRARLRAVGVSGELRFRTDRNTRLNVTHLLVYPGGHLQVGSSSRPIDPNYTAEIVFNNSPLETGTIAAPGEDPEQYGNGLLVWGALTLHGSRKSPFLRTTREPQEGDTSLVFERRPNNWRVGDTLLLPDSRQISEKDFGKPDYPPYNHEASLGIVRKPHWETVTIERIEGARVLLTDPLQHSHPGLRNAQSELTSTNRGALLLPHAANLTRNIILRSEEPSGVRGHTQYFRGARIDIAYSQFTDLGRTTIRELNNTRIDEHNTVLNIGTNQLARYPLHLHRTVDPGSIWESGYEFRVVGNVVNGGKRWGIVVHGSHFGLIADNVVFDIDGAGIVTEDGTETGNIFRHNFVSGIHGSGLPRDFRDVEQGAGHEGSGFWIASDNNEFFGNVAAGVRDSGFAFFRPEMSWSVPRFRHIKNTIPKAMTPEGQPRIFAATKNEVYGAAGSGLTLWSTKHCRICRLLPATIEEMTIWHSRAGVIFDYHADFYEISNVFIYGDVRQLSGTTGIYANNSRRAILRNSEIHNMDVGIEGGGSRNRKLVVDNLTINARVGMRILRSTSWGRMEPLLIHNTLFGYPDDLDVSSNGHWIEFGNAIYANRAPKLTQHRPVLIYGLQQQQGADFELFQHEQAPGAIVPHSNDAGEGCPEPGLTNAQCWQRHGVAFGGEIATCDNSHPHIDAFVCPADTR
jgi:hypothetical protein